MLHSLTFLGSALLTASLSRSPVAEEGAVTLRAGGEGGQVLQERAVELEGPGELLGQLEHRVQPLRSVLRRC